MRVALDTDILACAEGVRGSKMKSLAIQLIEKLPESATFIPVQVLGELFTTLVGKAGRSAGDARAAILSWEDAFPHIETSTKVLASAIDLAADHKFALWDALILATAAHAKCRLLLSEDLESGFTWSGLTVTNPFQAPQHALLSSLLNSNAS